MVCTLLVAQLPTSAHVPIKDLLAMREEIDSRLARNFIELVRQTLTDKVIPLDKGNRDFSRICMVQDKSEMNQVRGEEATSIPNKDFGPSLHTTVSLD